MHNRLLHIPKKGEFSVSCMSKKVIFGSFLLVFIYAFLLDSVALETAIYHLTVDNNSFEIAYEINADVIAMAIDKEQISLLIGVENTKDSLMSITLPENLLSAENNEFAVLVDGLEIDYDVISNESGSNLTFFVPEETQEIEIIGTYVVPEFTYGFLTVLLVLITTSIIITKTKGILFK